MAFLNPSARLSPLAVLALTLVIFLAPALNKQARAADEVSVVTLAKGLDHPWSLAFLPDGDFLVAELSGALRRVSASGAIGAPIAGVPEVYFAGQGGLMGLLLAADFAQTGTLFFTYAHGGPDGDTLRVARARLDGDALQDVTVILDTERERKTAVHYGGRLAFLPDGTLLVTHGDGFQYREEAQRLDSALGKIFRITTDGEAPSDNPFVRTADALDTIYSYGHRNVQGIAVDGATGRVYAHEHGPRGGDEINLIEPGRNYGWPVITLGIDYSGARISPFTEYEGMEQPLVDWTPSIAPSSLALYRGAVFPDWQGDLFTTGLVTRALHRTDLENGEAVGEERLLEDLGERLRDVRVGPRGYLYVLTDGPDGKLLRLEPAR